MFKTVHFTELKEFAARGQLERGARYLACHDSRDSSFGYGGAHVNDVVVASHAIQQDRYVDIRRLCGTTLDPEDSVMFAIYDRSNVVRWHHASDFGLWDLDVSYKDYSNYMLNVNDLLRQGIVVDTTPIEPPTKVKDRYLVS